MPCEACNIQFTVFKRKKPCMECRRLYCSNCLTKRKERFLCKRCTIFLARPLCKMELLKLRAKDLIFYLQSKHISTTGCVEKEELVNLVLIHVNNAGIHSPDSDRDSHENRSNPFDQLKNACQNLFTTFSEKIATDLNFDIRSSPSTGSNQSNVFSDQNSYRQTNRPSDSSFQSSNNRNQNDGHRPTYFESNQQRFTATTELYHSQTTSPNLLGTPQQSEGQQQQQRQPSLVTQPKRLPNERVKQTKQFDDGSGCECSDDEVITKFRREYSKSNDTSSSTSLASPQTNSTSSDMKKNDEQLNAWTKKDAAANESLDGSSFEDLGAVGCSSNPVEIDNNWQFVDKPAAHQTSLISSAPSMPQSNEPSTSMTDKSYEIPTHQCSIVDENTADEVPSDTIFQRHDMSRESERKILRRQSDGIVYIASSSNASRNLYNENTDNMDNINSQISKPSVSPIRLQTNPCKRCGKTKGDIRKYVARLRKQLETRTNSSESEIREQVEAFLKYLENDGRTSSEFKNDSSVSIESPTIPESEIASASPRTHANETNFSEILIEDYDEFDIDENEGINVYGSDDINAGQSTRQFFNLDRIESKAELDDLTVKQLKEVLMLNRIDFKGCCEKNELLDRVRRLWDDLQKCPSVDKLQTGDLCKICMDAAIECVLLECGHMATCTNCGKVLNECPICRQYIVRVVRFFKA